MGMEMIVFVQREPRPDAPYWSGRRWLAALDAVAWPVAGAMLVLQIPGAGRGAGMVVFVAALFALYRLCGALFVNHRYWFTTWWLARVAALLFLVGLVMKVALWVAAGH